MLIINNFNFKILNDSQKLFLLSMHCFVGGNFIMNCEDICSSSRKQSNRHLFIHENNAHEELPHLHSDELSFQWIIDSDTWILSLPNINTLKHLNTLRHVNSLKHMDTLRHVNTFTLSTWILLQPSTWILTWFHF